MTQSAIPGPAWIPLFLETLADTRKVGAAIERSGRTSNAIYAQRRRNKAFADAWDAALEMGILPTMDQASAGPAPAANSGWQKGFLAHLAETSNIKTSAERENVPLSTVYSLRARDGKFAASWQAALYEGYTNLEMEVLGYLRDPDPGYKMDVANALRLLAAHKESAARERARRGKRDRGEVLARLNAKIDKMRERKAAADKLMAELDTKRAGHDSD